MFDIFWNVSVRLVKWSHSPNHNEKLKEVLKYEKYSVQRKDVPSPLIFYSDRLLYVNNHSLPQDIKKPFGWKFWSLIIITRPPFGGLIELSGFIRKRDTKFWESVGWLPTQIAVCSFHCQVVLLTDDSILVTLEIWIIASITWLINCNVWFYSDCL